MTNAYPESSNHLFLYTTGQSKKKKVVCASINPLYYMTKDTSLNMKKKNPAIIYPNMVGHSNQSKEANKGIFFVYSTWTDEGSWEYNFIHSTNWFPSNNRHVYGYKEVHLRNLIKQPTPINEKFWLWFLFFVPLPVVSFSLSFTLIRNDGIWSSFNCIRKVNVTSGKSD